MISAAGRSSTRRPASTTRPDRPIRPSSMTGWRPWPGRWRARPCSTGARGRASPAGSWPRAAPGSLCWTSASRCFDTPGPAIRLPAAFSPTETGCRSGTGVADLTTFAQSWHWFQLPAAQAEVVRVLRPGGYWAAWWSRAKAGGQDWFDRYEDVLVRYCPGFTWRHLRDELLEPDWTADAIAARGLVEPAAPPWSFSGPAPCRSSSGSPTSEASRTSSRWRPMSGSSLSAELTEIITAEFPGGLMVMSLHHDAADGAPDQASPYPPPHCRPGSSAAGPSR